MAMDLRDLLERSLDGGSTCPIRQRGAKHAYARPQEECPEDIGDR